MFPETTFHLSSLTMASTSSLTHGSAMCIPDGPGFLGRLAQLLTLLGVLALGASGIGSFVLGQAPMTHWVLMAHVGSSSLFTIGLTLMALTWTPRLAGHNGIGQFFYWLLLLVGLVVILSGVLPMTPLTGTSGQHLLYLVHRYSGMAVAALAFLHLLTGRWNRA